MAKTKTRTAPKTAAPTIASAIPQGMLPVAFIQQPPQLPQGNNFSTNANLGVTTDGIAEYIVGTMEEKLDETIVERRAVYKKADDAFQAKKIDLIKRTVEDVGRQAMAFVRKAKAALVAAFLVIDPKSKLSFSPNVDDEVGDHEEGEIRSAKGAELEALLANKFARANLSIAAIESLDETLIDITGQLKIGSGHGYSARDSSNPWVAYTVHVAEEFRQAAKDLKAEQKEVAKLADSLEEAQRERSASPARLKKVRSQVARATMESTDQGKAMVANLEAVAHAQLERMGLMPSSKPGAVDAKVESTRVKKS